ncbi:hypothetical protein LAZ67_5003300 [Cordylochernes scorpioides]|uniref:Uncharacterized protein n=1 Tax=Cordylochernes scorpioides TaxID=51811 RepID=A0ABY6KK97_9ARAC|nr:hypothetical protein LAZ67_5003300 [Cordylochernes scorpioides]
MEYKRCSSCILGLGTLTGNQSEQMGATDLALYIHSQLALCSNPRNFVGTDLVSLLERKVEKAAPGSYSPLVPLSLCNSGVELSPQHLGNIAYFLRSNSTDSFITDLAGRLKIKTRIVRRIVKQSRERGHYGMLPKSGRPRTVNISASWKIIKRIARNDGVRMNRIASDFEISREGVQNIVKRVLGLRRYRLHRGQTLSEAAMNNRLDKAKKFLSMIRVGRHRVDGRDFHINDSLLPAAWVLRQRHVVFKLLDLNPMDYYVGSNLEQNVSSFPYKSLESLKKALQRDWAKIDVKCPRWSLSPNTSRPTSRPKKPTSI